MSKLIVVSGVNFSEGGPLTVMRACLEECVHLKDSDWKIVALVHDVKLFNIPGIEYMCFPDSKRSWFKRLYHEFVLFHRLSLQLKPDVWLSMHDISPRVVARCQAVYCHNPSPFYSSSLVDLRFDPSFFLFTLLYKQLYRINIKANRFVIVQQEWLREAFQRMYSLSNVLVAYPIPPGQPTQLAKQPIGNPVVFLYPALPRTFKNFETLCEAAIKLNRRTSLPFEVRITLSGEENRYAKWLKERFGQHRFIKFIGCQNKDGMLAQYAQADAVVFPSRLETWGLPITEAKQLGKRLIVADLPYAHETTGAHEDVMFFPPQDADALSICMLALISDKARSPQRHQWQTPREPFATNWRELIQMLTQ